MGTKETRETLTLYNKNRGGFDEEEKGDVEGAENKADDDEEEVYEEERGDDEKYEGVNKV